jgi:hypothetical protein
VTSSEILRAVATERVGRLRAEADQDRSRRSSGGGRDADRGTGRTADRKLALAPDEVYPDEPTPPTAGRRTRTGSRR